MIIGKDLKFKTLNEAVEHTWEYALEEWSIYSMSLFDFKQVDIDADRIPAEYIPKELIGISESDLTIEQFDLWCNARDSYALDFEFVFEHKVIKHILSLFNAMDGNEKELKMHLNHILKRVRECTESKEERLKLLEEGRKRTRRLG